MATATRKYDHDWDQRLCGPTANTHNVLEQRENHQNPLNHPEHCHMMAPWIGIGPALFGSTTPATP